MEKKDKRSLKEKIREDEDFIYCPRLGNSLKTLMEKNDLGVSDERICKVLLIDQKELDEIFESALEKFRKGINRQ